MTSLHDPHRPSRWLLATLLWVVTAACWSSCEGPDDRMSQCVAYASMLADCMSASGEQSQPSGAREGYLIKSCQSKVQREPGIISSLECAGLSLGDCGALFECLEANARGRDQATLQHALDTNDQRYVLTLCAVKPDLKGCRDAKMHIIDRYLDRELVAIRDGEGTQAASTACFRAKAVAKGIEDLPESVQAHMHMRCREASVGKHVREVEALAKTHIESRSDNVPRRCQTVLAQLRRIEGSSWARKAEAKLASACYEELGRIVLKLRLARAKGCDPVLAEVVGAIRTYGLKGPRLTALYRSAKQLCAASPVATPDPETRARRGSDSKAPKAPDRASSRPR